MSSESECKQKCLDERSFYCRSADYSYGECYLSKDNRMTASFSWATGYNSYVYLERSCSTGTCITPLWHLSLAPFNLRQEYILSCLRIGNFLKSILVFLNYPELKKISFYNLLQLPLRRLATDLYTSPRTP